MRSLSTCASRDRMFFNNPNFDLDHTGDADTGTVADGGLLNAEQHFGHRRFSSQILALQSLPRSTDLATVGSGSPLSGAGRDNRGDSIGRRDGGVVQSRCRVVGLQLARRRKAIDRRP